MGTCVCYGPGPIALGNCGGARAARCTLAARLATHSWIVPCRCRNRGLARTLASQMWFSRSLDTHWDALVDCRLDHLHCKVATEHRKDTAWGISGRVCCRFGGRARLHLELMSSDWTHLRFYHLSCCPFRERCRSRGVLWKWISLQSLVASMCRQLWRESLRIFRSRDRSLGKANLSWCSTQSWGCRTFPAMPYPRGPHTNSLWIRNEMRPDCLCRPSA